MRRFYLIIQKRARKTYCCCCSVLFSFLVALEKIYLGTLFSFFAGGKIEKLLIFSS